METPERLSKQQAYRGILRYVVPCLTELLLSQLVSMIDMIMVGGLGTRAINAVGINTNPLMLLLMVFSALNVGTTALISRAKGEGDIAKANRVMHCALIVSGTLGVLMTALGYLLAKPLVAMMGAGSAELAAMAVSYLRWRLIGSVLPVALTSAVTASLRGMGDARTAMFYNLFANGVNVLFNWLLIHGIGIFPEMGVNGAALATSISQIVAMVTAFGVLLHGCSQLKLRLFQRLRLDKAYLSNLFRIGLPAMAEQLVFRIGMILFGRLTVSLGEVGYAAHQLCWNILNILLLIGQAFQMATAPLTGQCLGRNDAKRAEEYNRHAFWMLFCTMALCGLMCNLFGRPLMLLYSPEPEVLEAGLPVLRIFSASLPILAFQCTYNGALQGAGDTKWNAPIFMFTTLCIRIPTAMVFKDVLHWGLVGVNAASIVDQVIRAALFYWRYRSGKWKQIRFKQ